MRRKLTGKWLPCLLIFILILTQTAVSFGAEDAEETGEMGENMNIFFDIDSDTDIRVYPSPNRAVNQIEGSRTHVVIENAKAGDVYSYRAVKDSHYEVHTAFVLSEADIRRGTRRIKVHLDPISGNGYEPRLIYRWSDEVEEKLFSLSTLKNVDTSVLDTPSFAAGKKAHEYANDEECIAYLNENLGENGYLYDLDATETLPVVIFSRSDLSGAASLSDALKKIKASGRLKIMYQAQIHGNEPAAGEGAFAVAKTLAGAGSRYLDNTDVILMPRVNSAGARGYLRGCNGLDLNRDGLAVKSEITRKLHWLYNQVKPEVFIDGHEFDGKKYFIEERDGMQVLKGLDDIQVTGVNSLNRSSSVYRKEKEILKNTLTGLREKGFRTFLYKPSVDGKTSCSYARNHGSLTFLVESNGIGLGKSHLERRVLSQHDAVMSLIAQSSSRADDLKKTVKDARSRLISRGKVYEPKDAFVLRHGADSAESVTLPREEYDYFGHVISEQGNTDTFVNLGTVRKKRSRPTAYILSKKASCAPQVKRMLDKHEIKYFTTKKKKKILVRRYCGTETKASITKKKTVTFMDGAYVIYMNQEHANLISTLFEPDVANGDGNESLVQMGIIKGNAKKQFPIYRTEIKEPLKNLK